MGTARPEGAERTIEKIKAKHGPEIIAKQTTDPKVAKAVAANPKATRAVGRQQAARTKEIVENRKKAAAANPTASAQTAAAVDAAGASDDMRTNSPEYNAFTRGNGDMQNAWGKGIHEQSFTPLDWHMLGSDLPALRRLVDEITVFVETDDDPYQAVMDHRVEQGDLMQRQMDEAEADTDIDRGLDEIEQFANKAG